MTFLSFSIYLSAQSLFIIIVVVAYGKEGEREEKNESSLKAFSCLGNILELLTSIFIFNFSLPIFHFFWYKFFYSIFVCFATLYLQYNIKKKEEVVEQLPQEEPNPLMRKKKTPEELAAEAEAEDLDDFTSKSLSREHFISPSFLSFYFSTISYFYLLLIFL